MPNSNTAVNKESNFTLIPLNDNSLAEAGIPLKAETFYKWRKQRKHLQIFTKIGGRVFIVRQKWNLFIQKGMGKVR